MPASIRPAHIATISFVGALAVAVTVAQQAPNLSSRWLSEYPLPAIDRGLRDQDPPRPPRTTALTYLPGTIVVKFRAGTSATARRSMAAIVDGDMGPALSNANFDVMRLEAGADRGAGSGPVECPARRGLRAGALPGPAALRPQRPVLLAAVELPRHRHGARLGHQHRRRRRPSPSRSWTRASRIAAACCGRRRIAWTREDGVRFPALGTVDIPFAAAPDLAGPDRFVAPRDFIWGDVLPFDMDGHGTHVVGNTSDS